ncbi:MAG TPA: 2,3-diaminopropionate biosynthesis protein SbnB [Blastocatellia bacterium]|nr:2,3-diaminopropionate biosynthesis protein SbnB [Blastocatellia bacterium]
MQSDDILILKGIDVISLLANRELQLIETVRAAYETHARGHSSLPHSLFLNFPGDGRNRIIALPAYLGDGFEVAGVKWVSSFPGNLDMNLDRASAVLIVNSRLTGRPEAIIEGSVISAKRTAASAALAAQTLHDFDRPVRVGMIGCGLINFEIARMLQAAIPKIVGLTVFDLDPARALHFRDECQKAFNGIEVEIAGDADTVLRETSLVSFATTASTPHIDDLSICAPGTTVLHVSLRDLSPEVILSCDNIADDIDHVCRAQTSIHLTEQKVGNRGFVRCTLADILLNREVKRKDPDAIAVFSPFGLGVLDIAVGKLVCELAIEQGKGIVIESFLPASWSDKNNSRATAR